MLLLAKPQERRAHRYGGRMKIPEPSWQLHSQRKQAEEDSQPTATSPNRFQASTHPVPHCHLTQAGPNRRDADGRTASIARLSRPDAVIEIV